MIFLQKRVIRIPCLVFHNNLWYTFFKFFRYQFHILIEKRGEMWKRTVKPTGII